jgi:hypothetical protein
MSFNCATLFVQQKGYFTTLLFCFPALGRRSGDSFGSFAYE